MAAIPKLNTPNAKAGDTLASDPTFHIKGIVNAARGVYAWERTTPELTASKGGDIAPANQKQLRVGDRWNLNPNFRIYKVISAGEGLYMWRKYPGIEKPLSDSIYLAAPSSGTGGPTRNPFAAIGHGDNYQPQAVIRHGDDVDRSSLRDRALQVVYPDGTRHDLFAKEAPSNTYNTRKYPGFSDAILFQAEAVVTPPQYGRYLIVTTEDERYKGKKLDGSPIDGDELISEVDILEQGPVQPVEVPTPDGWYVYGYYAEAISFAIVGTGAEAKTRITMTEAAQAVYRAVEYDAGSGEITLNLTGVSDLSGDIEFGSKSQYNGQYYWDAPYGGNSAKISVALGDNTVVVSADTVQQNGEPSNPVISAGDGGGALSFDSITKA